MGLTRENLMQTNAFICYEVCMLFSSIGHRFLARVHIKIKKTLEGHFHTYTVGSD